MEVVVVLVVFKKLHDKKIEAHIKARAKSKWPTLNADTTSDEASDGDNLLINSKRNTQGYSMTSNASEISESNLRSLKNAYRHPFEYISPLLYRKNTARVELESKSLMASDLFCANEEDFQMLFASNVSSSSPSRSPSPSIRSDVAPSSF